MNFSNAITEWTSKFLIQLQFLHNIFTSFILVKWFVQILKFKKRFQILFLHFRTIVIWIIETIFNFWSFCDRNFWSRNLNEIFSSIWKFQLFEIFTFHLSFYIYTLQYYHFHARFLIWFHNVEWQCFVRLFFAFD